MGEKNVYKCKNLLGNFRGSSFEKMNLTFTKSFSCKKNIIYNYLKKKKTPRWKCKT